MKKTLPLFMLVVLASFFSCQKHNPSPALSREKPTAPDPSALDRFIQAKVEETGEFLWSWASDDQVWTALANADFVLSVGYQPPGFQNLDDKIHQIDLSDAVWQQARTQVLDLILASEQKATPGLQLENILSYRVEGIPTLNVRVTNPETVGLLRASALVRYAEPIGYEPFMRERIERSSSGCDGNGPEPGLVLNQDYTNILPGCKQSWNHTYHNINSAWANSTGSGTRVVIVDTGSSDDQGNLNEDFNQGYSASRSLSRLVTLPQETNFWGNPVGAPETPHDQCGHGTSMAGACAAPRGTDGASSGIAYNANLTTYRAAADVYLDESREVTGVSNAFTQAGTNSAVRIISMSMGRITSSSQIRDAIKVAYNNGKMVFCAAGTSFSWTAWFTGVIFPASMTEAIAVTGIKDNLTNRCNACHQGSKVDFVMVMEKNNSSERHPLSLDMNSDDPSTVGGSSVATASVAGIAALVWSKYPGWSRTQVFDRLKTSSNYFPTRNSNFGWGRINAQVATQ
jgi:subtilisin family serine protease